MFRRSPYWGWLILGIVLWCFAGYRFYTHTRDIAPAGMTKTIQNDLVEKENNFEDLLNDSLLADKIFSNKLTKDDVTKLIKLPYYLYAYRNDTLVFWNNNKVLADCIGNTDSSEKLLYNERGVFITKCVKVNNGNKKHFTALFPVLIQYPFENKYLISHFSAGTYIPISTRIHASQVKDGYAVKNTEGQNIFYLKYNPTDLPTWIPDPAILMILIAALLATIAWLQLISINISRKRSNILGLVITVAVIIGFRALTYKFGLPFNLENLPIFSPTLYATSALHRSLGDLLLNALSFLWIVAYLIGNIEIESIDFSGVKKPIRIALSVLLSALIIIFAFTFINMINSLVVDSMIPFDVSHFYSINKYTIYGLFTVGIITISCCLVIYLLNTIFSKLVSKRWFKYLSIAIIGIAVILFSDTTRTGYLSYYLLSWLLLFVALLDVKKLAYTNDVLAPHMIFWAFFVCIFCTAVLQYFNNIKEKEARKRFADEIVQQRDLFTEDVVFKPISENIQKDRIVQAFIEDPTREGRLGLNERFEMLYLGGQMNKYQSRVFVFDNDGRSLYNNDTLSYNALWKQLKKAIPTSDSTLYFKEYAQDGHNYLASIPIYGDDSTRKGYVFIDLAIKESTGETVYPELLQPGTVNTNVNADYSYAIYFNNKLLTQTNDYTFPIFFNRKLKDEYTFSGAGDDEEMWYRADENKIAVVVHKQKLWLESITLFSYLFGIQVLVAVMIVFYKSLLSFIAKPRRTVRLVNFTLRRRIHFSMLGIVLVSFFIIGIVTIVYFTYQYKQNTHNKLLGLMQVIERSTTQYLEQQNGLSNPAGFNNATNNNLFKYFIVNQANTQKVDINIYNASGILNVTSQDNIYDRSLLSRIMRQDAYFDLAEQNKSLLTQDETIGKLSYLSCYVPIRDEDGNTMGYINIPYYSSQKELSYQISNILVALINLYAFIFLLSGLFTVIITRWITRSFNVVIERFEKLNLSQNELIEWPYDDEIGVLVQEYNKMVKKVEENAITMAQSERESAWREMAQQVAHEIKNPLTPMKLNIQYLQQALKNDYANINELTGKVSESLIEQIDNLSYIASEFSNFAKMPEARPERVDVNTLICAATELYLNDGPVKVTVEPQKEPLIVFTDRNQLLRVLTNLLQNAVQSIPEDRNGLVRVVAEKQNNTALLSIIDNGTGIDKEIIEKIFQPYFTTKTSGTGLGLAMTKKIIEFWKGEIWFETEEDKGTTFFIRLPLDK